jgi:sec-independent protein translocase protein TatA
MFSQIGMPELLLIMLIVLLVFGAKKLPEIGSSMGKGIREFKKSIRDVQGSLDVGDDNAPPTRSIDEATKVTEGEPKKLSQ